jgi:hypothetical protein
MVLQEKTKKRNGGAKRTSLGVLIENNLFSFNSPSNLTKGQKTHDQKWFVGNDIIGIVR